MSSAENINKNIEAKKINIEELSHLRFFTILLIVCNHLGCFWGDTNVAKESSAKIWFDFTSPILAIVSGWLFFFNLQSGSFLSKIKKKISSIFLPYIVWTLVYIVVHSLFKHTYLWLGKSPIWNSPIPSLTWNYFLDAVILHPIVPNFWYLQNLILAIPLNWFILKAVEKPYAFEFFYGIIVLLIYLRVPILFSDRFIQYYLVGCYFGSKRVILRCGFVKNRIILIGIILFLFFLESKIRAFDHARLINLPVIFLMVLTILELLRQNEKSKLHHFSEKLQRHSFFIFASHALILSIVTKGALLFLPQSFLIKPEFYPIFLTFQFFATVSSCTLFSELILMRSRYLWLIMVGQRGAALAR